MAAAVITISTVNSFTDSGQEFALDCVLNIDGTYTSGGDDASATFNNIAVKTRSFPKSGFGISTTGLSLYLDTANKKISLWNGSTEASGALSNLKVAARFYFKKA